MGGNNVITAVRKTETGFYELCKGGMSFFVSMLINHSWKKLLLFNSDATSKL